MVNEDRIDDPREVRAALDEAQATIRRLRSAAHVGQRDGGAESHVTEALRWFREQLADGTPWGGLDTAKVARHSQVIVRAALADDAATETGGVER